MLMLIVQGRLCVRHSCFHKSTLCWNAEKIYLYESVTSLTGHCIIVFKAAPWWRTNKKRNHAYVLVSWNTSQKKWWTAKSLLEKPLRRTFCYFFSNSSESGVWFVFTVKHNVLSINIINIFGVPGTVFVST